MLLGVVDHRGVELLGEDVAQHADREIGLLEGQRRRLDLVGALDHHLMEAVQVVEVALEVLLARALGRGAHDHAAVVLVELLQQLALAIALRVGQAARGADAGTVGHVDEVAPRDRDLHRKACALRLQRVLDDLDEDLLLRLDELVDAPAVAVAAPRRLLAVGGDDLVDVQEAVSLQADVDERRLHAWQDVVDDALVDVADDRARATPFDVELGDLEAVRATLLRADALAFEYRDAGLTRVDGDENSFLDLNHLKTESMPRFEVSCACE